MMATVMLLAACGKQEDSEAAKEAEPMAAEVNKADAAAKEAEAFALAAGWSSEA
jgi:hypothetical protein